MKRVIERESSKLIFQTDIIGYTVFASSASSISTDLIKTLFTRFYSI